MSEVIKKHGIEVHLAEPSAEFSPSQWVKLEKYEELLGALKNLESYGTMSPDDPGEILIEILSIARQAIAGHNGTTNKTNKGE